ncbi:hypothetical protein QUF74_15725, partial [Candidatus Halobeggiatoa sp. HSG11]|nr:hypothetical protein [Candidatus Halobeggiatoa sp. HSG11]
EPISYKYGKITNLLIIGQLKTHTEFFMLRYTYGYLSFVRLSALNPFRIVKTTPTGFTLE